MMERDLEPMANYARQSVGLDKDRKSVQKILDEIVGGAIRPINSC